MAIRYKGKVRDWSMWNEPNIKGRTPAVITDFNIRTAEIIKRVIPDARIGALVLTWPDPVMIEDFMKTLAERKKLDLFEWIVFHLYSQNPDTAYPRVTRAAEIIRRYSPTIKLWQGEAGVQSEWGPAGALSRYPWTELTQAKWMTRRMLGDIGHDLDSALLSIADLDYRTTPGHMGLLRYGLLKTAGAVEGFKVLAVKMAYYSVQNLVSVFNDDVELIFRYPCEVTCAKPDSGFPALILTWRARSRPGSLPRSCKPLRVGYTFSHLPAAAETGESRL